MKVKVTLDDEVVFDSSEPRPTPPVLALAKLYAGLDDDAQAQFFEHVGQIFDSWPRMGGDSQAYFIGRHMRTCSCITEAGRRFLESVVTGMKPRGGAGENV